MSKQCKIWIYLFHFKWWQQDEVRAKATCLLQFLCCLIYRKPTICYNHEMFHLDVVFSLNLSFVARIHLCKMLPFVYHAVILKRTNYFIAVSCSFPHRHYSILNNKMQYSRMHVRRTALVCREPFDKMFNFQKIFIMCNINVKLFLHLPSNNNNNN